MIADLVEVVGFDGPVADRFVKFNVRLQLLLILESALRVIVGLDNNLIHRRIYRSYHAADRMHNLLGLQRETTRAGQGEQCQDFHSYAFHHPPRFWKYTTISSAWRSFVQRAGKLELVE